MKTYLIPVLIFLLSAGCTRGPEQKWQTSLESFQLSGPVEEIQEDVYNKKNKHIVTNIYLFDEKGMLYEEKYKYENGEDNYLVEYDALNRPLYYLRGYGIDTVYYNPDSTEMYGGLNSPTLKTIVDSIGRPVWNSIRPVPPYPEDAPATVDCTVFAYKANLSMKQTRFVNGNLLWKKDYTYDANQKIQETTKRYTQGSVKLAGEKYFYSDDKYNNWTRKIVLDDGDTITGYNRKYKYRKSQ